MYLQFLCPNGNIREVLIEDLHKCCHQYLGHRGHHVFEFSAIHCNGLKVNNYNDDTL